MRILLVVLLVANAAAICLWRLRRRERSDAEPIASPGSADPVAPSSNDRAPDKVAAELLRGLLDGKLMPSEARSRDVRKFERARIPTILHRVGQVARRHRSTL